MTKTFERIMNEHVPRWAELFGRKSAEYGDRTHHDLGIRGQFSDIYRKVVKLKRFMWDEPDASPEFEDLEEICFDLIGHLFMTVDLLHQKVEQEQGHRSSTPAAFLGRLFDLVSESRESEALEMIRAQMESRVATTYYVGPKEVAARELLEDIYQEWKSLGDDDYDEVPEPVRRLIKAAAEQKIVGVR